MQNKKKVDIYGATVLSQESHKPLSKVMSYSFLFVISNKNVVDGISLLVSVSSFRGFSKLCDLETDILYSHLRKLIYLKHQVWQNHSQCYIFCNYCPKTKNINRFCSMKHYCKYEFDTAWPMTTV